MAKIGVEKFLGLSQTPEYGRNPGWLSSCANYRVRPGGYLECRNGFSELAPAGGTGASAIAAGFYTGAHEHVRTDPYVIRYTHNDTTYSNDLSQFAYILIWRTTAGNFAANDAFYIGSDSPFSRVVFKFGQGTYANPGSDPTYLYEYSKTGWSATAAGGTLTLTNTPDFNATGEQIMEWQLPTVGGSGWVPMAVNGIYAYWVRIRVSNVGGGISTAVMQSGTGTTVSSQRIYTDSPGARQLWASGADATAGTNVGALKFWGQSDATTAAWTSVSTSLFSGNYARHRFASYKNLLYMVNSKEQKRYSGAAYASAAYNTHALNEIGFTAPVLAGASAADSGGGSGLTGIFRYAVSYGYGPAGEWGESNATTIGTTGGIVDNTITVTYGLSGAPDAGIVDALYLYRSADLTNVPTSAQDSFPMYRINVAYRDSAGAFPTTYTDGTLAFPFPPVEMKIIENAPPARCKFIVLHKNRLFLGSNNQYPGRVWWSEPFEVEAYNQDENYADFTRQTGGQITGMAEFNDQVVVFTEDQIFGISNVDEDVPSIYVIAPGVGCIAPESIAVNNGVIMWLAKDGIYLWDGSNPQVTSEQRVSDELVVSYRRATRIGYYDSMAVLHDRQYWIRPATEKHALVGGGNDMVYELETKSWHTLDPDNAGVSAGGPLTTFTAPISHGSAGQRFIFWGAFTAQSQYKGYLGPYQSTDDGTAIQPYFTVHLGPKGHRRFIKGRVAVYYAGGGTISIQDGGAQIGYDTPSPQTNTADAGLDYSKIEAIYAQRGRGVSDINITFVSSTGGSGHQVYAVYVEGEWVDPVEMDS